MTTILIIWASVSLGFFGGICWHAFAAKIAEDRSQPLSIHTDMERGHAQARKDAAWAIRSLIQPPA